MDDEAQRSSLIINGRALTSTDSVIRVGRDPDTDVRFTDERVSRVHAVIEPVAGGWLLKDTSSRGTFLDGARVTSVPIRGAVTLRLGHQTEGPQLIVALGDAPAAGIERLQIGDRVFDASQSPIVVGRGPEATIRLDDGRVSREHLRIDRSGSTWVLTDVSTRGTFLTGRKIDRLDLADPVEVRLGDPDTGPVIAITPEARSARPGAAMSDVSEASRLGRLSVVFAGGDRVRIGRAPDNEVVLSDLRVSRYHAEILKRADGYELNDLGSHNGSFVNGERATNRALATGDIVSIGGHVLRFVDGRLEAYEDRGEAWLLASALTVTTADGKRILDGVDLAIPPATLVAVVGPSGSGKTTLLGAIAGFKPAQSGSVWYGGRDLYASYADLRQIMGLVPQSDIIHTELTVRGALRYAAALRFPGDVDFASREARVDEVISDLGLTARADTQIELLSGGQRKRVSVGLELLTKPSLLFLDEPTSGLDPANEDQVISLIEALADDGRIVVVATHSIETLRRADRVLFMAPGGHMAFYGTPDDALDHFAPAGGSTDFASIFRMLETEPDADWAGRYRATDIHEELVRQPLVQAEMSPTTRPQVDRAVRAPVGPIPQLGTLVRRYLSVMASDRRNVLVTLLQAPFFGLLIAAIFLGATVNQLSCEAQPNGTLILWLLVVGATWLGASNAIREIVKELPIYRRERSVGLSLSAYIGSKALVLGVITVAQCAVMVAIVLAIHPLPSNLAVDPNSSCAIMENSAQSALLPFPVIEVIVGVALGGIAAMALALALSALVTRPDKAAALLPYVLIAMTLLSQPFVEADALEPVTNAASANWSLASVASTMDLNRSRSPYLFGVDYVRSQLATGSDEDLQDCVLGVDPAACPDTSPDGAYRGVPAWTQDPATWIWNIAVLLVMTLAGLLAAAYALRRHDVALLDAREAAGRPGRRIGSRKPIDA